MCTYIKSLLEEYCKRLTDNLDYFKKLEYRYPSIILTQTSCKDFENLPFLNVFTHEKDIPNSKATVERIFSIMNIVKNKMINRLSLY